MSDDPLIAEFLEESLDSLTSLDEKLAVLEGSSDLVADVNQVFRPVHSIKGAASFFKLTGLMTLSHKLETVLDQLRQGEMAVSDNVVNQLQRGFFLLRSLVERGLEQGDHEMGPEDDAFMLELESLLNGGGDAQKKQAFKAIVSALKGADEVLAQTILAQLDQLCDFEEPVVGEDPLADVVSLIHLQVETPSEATLDSIRKRCKELLESNKDTKAFCDALNGFLSDFEALATSPVGIDELMVEVLIDHLSNASACCPDQEEDEPAAEEVTPAPAETATPAKSPEPSSNRAESKSIRINVQLLEDIMNLMSELVLSRNELNVHASKFDDPDLGKTTQQVSTIMTELQEKVMKTRLQPVSTVFNPLPGVVREVSRALGKEVELILEGKSTELDRGVLEGIKDPLTHIIRNSLDHGIESPQERKDAGKAEKGKLLISAFHEGGQVVIQIKDDGKGVNVERVTQKAIEKGLYTVAQIGAMTENQKAEIIFNPGFSTAEQVSQVSGRGVGMDVVKSNIVNLGGQVELDSRWGQGTSLRLKIPLTLAIAPALIVGAQGNRYAIPQMNLEEMVFLKHDELDLVEKIRGTEVFRLRGNILPVVRLNKTLGVDDHTTDDGLHIVVLSSGSKQFGLIVEELFDIEEIVVKSLSDFFEDVHLFSGSTILGDGSIALIFDVVEISKMVGLDVSQSTTSAQEETAAVAEMQGQVLLFSLATPCMYGIPMAYVERLEQVETTSVDVVNDEWYLRYRGKILPLISCWQSMALKQPDPLPEEIDLVIYRHGVTEIGFVVNDIVDVVPLEGVLTKDVNVEPYILGSAIVQKKIVTMINLPHLAKSKFGKELLSEGKERLLVWDSDPTNDFKELKQKGYSVTAVHSIEEAEEAIRNVDVDVVLTESEIDDEDRDLINESLLEKYGPDKCIEIVSLTTEDSEGWQSQLDSDQLKGVLNDMLESQLKS